VNFPFPYLLNQPNAGNSSSTVFKSIYGLTTSSQYNITINFSEAVTSATEAKIQSTANNKTVATIIPGSSTQATAEIPLVAGSSNEITILSSQPIDSIKITPPNGTYYPSTVFSTTGNAKKVSCGTGYCRPVGSKIGEISPNSTVSAVISTTAGKKYLAIDYINNEVAFDSAWGWGSNSRNLTVSVNGEEPVRVEVPLSGQHSELFGPGLGWWDTATIGVLVNGWKDGDNEIVIGNEGGEAGFQSYGPDFVGLRVL
jgi:alpha-galactosidase